MEYVIGVDLGTSSVKALLVDQQGHVCNQTQRSYPLIRERSGWSEQNPEVWVASTIDAVRSLVAESKIHSEKIQGLSFSGQMHGLVLLDAGKNVIRNAILWNDTRTTKECGMIEEKLGEQLLSIAKNNALEGFTLPKLLWVKANEPDNFARIDTFLLPKDYLRFRLTGTVSMEHSDAAGTIMYDVGKRRWSEEILGTFDIPYQMCPPVFDSAQFVGMLIPEIAAKVGLSAGVRVFAGGADNACGAIGAGILSPGSTMCSIGTSGVVLHHEGDSITDYHGKLHFFNHAQPNAFYSMGVTLAAGYSLSWFRNIFLPDLSFDNLLTRVKNVPIGSKGLLYTPYLVGERTPYADANVRGSFIGIDVNQSLDCFTRAVVEGITFSLRDSIEIMRREGRKIETIVAIGGGAKNDTWLQIQADTFNSHVARLDSEQGPALGAAMLAAVGCEWFGTLQECAKIFLKINKVAHPISEHVEEYEKLYHVYRDVYRNTRQMSKKLETFRR